MRVTNEPDVEWKAYHVGQSCSNIALVKVRGLTHAARRAPTAFDAKAQVAMRLSTSIRGGYEGEGQRSTQSYNANIDVHRCRIPGDIRSNGPFRHRAMSHWNHPMPLAKHTPIHNTRAGKDGG